MTTQTTSNTTVQSPANNAFVSATFKAFKSGDIQTQHASQKKLAEQVAIDLAREKFLASGKQVKIACTGKIDQYNEKTGKFGLVTVQTYKTKEALENSTFVSSKDQDFSDLKADFSAKGIGRYAFGMTKKPIQSKSATRFDMLQEVRRNFSARKNLNGTKGILSKDSSIKQGMALEDSKTEKINGMLAAQARLSNVEINQTEKTTESMPATRKPSLTASFASIIANSWKSEKAEKAAKIDFAKSIAENWKAAKVKKAKAEKVAEIKDIFPVIVESTGQLSFDLS